MEIFPQVTQKLLRDCEPGNLIRIKWGDDQHYGMVAAGKHQRFLTLLGSLRAPTPPGITLLERPDWLALCYGSDYRIELDQSAEHVDVTGQRLWEKSGALWLTSDYYIMHLSPLYRSGLHGSFYVRLDTGTLADEPTSGAAIFGKWSLMLPKGAGEYETLFTI